MSAYDENTILSIYTHIRKQGDPPCQFPGKEVEDQPSEGGAGMSLVDMFVVAGLAIVLYGLIRLGVAITRFRKV